MSAVTSVTSQAAQAVQVATPAVSPVVTTPQAPEAAVHAGQSAASGVTSALAHTPAESLFSWSGYFEALGLIFLIIAGLWAIVWFIRRRNTAQALGKVPTMLIESRLALAPKKWVVVTRFMNKRLVLGLTDESITLLTEMEISPDGDEQGAANSGAFTAFLRSSQDEGKD